MDFTPTEDRRMLSDMLRRYLAEHCTLEARNAAAYATPWHDPGLWDGLAELGVIGALVAEDHGGFGGHGFDIATVFEELGRAICPEPLLGALMCAQVLAAAGREDLLADLIAGSSRFALAVFEPSAPDDIAGIAATATQGDDGWRLEGHKTVVYGAPAADHLLVAAQSGDGIGVFLVKSPEVHAYGMIDGGGAGDVVFDGIAAELVLANATDPLNTALDAGRLALCAEALGAMDVLLEATRDYLMQRRQFGRPIATFQALQHRLVDMAIELEQARAIVILAASSLDTDESATNVAKAKNLVGRAATLIAEEALQMHGGIGMTWEYMAAHYAKRLIMIDHQLGDQHLHLRRVAGI